MRKIKFFVPLYERFHSRHLDVINYSIYIYLFTYFFRSITFMLGSLSISYKNKLYFYNSIKLQKEVANVKHAVCLISLIYFLPLVCVSEHLWIMSTKYSILVSSKDLDLDLISRIYLLNIASFYVHKIMASLLNHCC